MPEVGNRYILCAPRGERLFCNIIGPGPEISYVEYYRLINRNGKAVRALFKEFANNKRIVDTQTYLSFVYAPPVQEQEAA